MSLDPHPTHLTSPPSDRPQAGRASGPAGSPPSPANLWDIDDVAAFLGVTKQTIYSWRTTGYGPAGFRVGKHLRWRPTTVVAWTVRLEECQ